MFGLHLTEQYLENNSNYNPVKCLINMIICDHF